jgi:hypothetical protein
MSAGEHTTRRAGDRNSAALSMLVLGVFVLVSRIPFLSAGYGNVNDAWRVAAVAHRISATGHYWASRFPPHPVQELLDSLLWRGGPLALNAITALLSVGAVLLFASTLKILGCRSYFWGGAALAFTPVIYLNSTNSTDYVWALAFILASLHFILKLRPGIAGILLGLAIGSRITSGAMLLPLSLLLAQRAPTQTRCRGLLVFIVVANIVGGITFLPVFLTYGLRFLTFYESQHPTVLEAFKTATIYTWGGLGCLGIFFAACACLARRARRQDVAWKEFAIWCLTIVLYAIAFVRLPHQPGYLVPLVPFVILAFSTVLRRTAFVAFCAMLALPSFVAITRGGVIAGHIISDHRNRIESVQQLERILRASHLLAPNTVIIAGHWLPRLEVYLPDRGPRGVTWVYLLSRDELAGIERQGNHIVYLPDQKGFELKEENVDLEVEGASPLLY